MGLKRGSCSWLNYLTELMLLLQIANYIEVFWHTALTTGAYRNQTGMPHRMQGSGAQLMEEYMSHAIRQPRILLALIGSISALWIGLGSADQAQAAWSNYCGGAVSSGQTCIGAKRWLNKTYGWGDQAGVCVGIVEFAIEGCTSNAGTGVYSAGLGTDVYKYPYIRNNSGGSNFLHGIALSS
jgi:hypothetical protein